MKKDVNFLQSKRLIDYSLLIIVIKKKKEEIKPFKYKDVSLKNHKNNRNNNSESNYSSLRSSKNDEILYKFGIIDYLQVYNVKKKVEEFGKKFLNFDANLNISCQDPITYSNRFYNFIQQCFGKNL